MSAMPSRARRDDEEFASSDRDPDQFHTSARPLPRISIGAFCDDRNSAQVIQAAAEDRRFSKVHVAIHMGGASAAATHFASSPTPNLIIIDSKAPADDLLGELDRLAEHCDAGTKVIVIGHINDVSVYRELLKRGVSEYLVAPLSAIEVIESISNLYSNPSSGPLGQVWAFIGAKGGVGASTICHNVSWATAESLQSNVVIGDFDLPFGTTGLDFNQDPDQGIGDALASPDRLDQVLLDRLLTKCTEHLSIFASPSSLHREYDLSPDACDHILDVVRQNVPYFALDIPHMWTAWSRRVLMGADEIAIVAEPDLANLRNAKNLIDLLKKSRQNDFLPHLIVNMVNKPKRQEIPTKEFCDSVGLKPAAVIEFDAESFSRAANNGQMVEQENKKAKAVAQFKDIALILSHKARTIPVETRSSAFTPILRKLGLQN